MKGMTKLLARYTDNELIYLSHLGAESLRLFVECGRDMKKLRDMKGHTHAGYTLHTQLRLALYRAVDLDRDAYIMQTVVWHEKELQQAARLRRELPKRIAMTEKLLARYRKELKDLTTAPAAPTP